MSHKFFEELTVLCQELLYSDTQLFNYLKSRNITASTIKKHRLGSFPTKITTLLERMPGSDLIENGIIWNAAESQFLMSISPASRKKIHYPIVIPVFNTDGHPVAIGCRTLISDANRKDLGIPKYRNSFYEKTAYLFGLDKAIGAIRDNDRVFVVEGYFDVIACHQAGLRNVVATCGTLFSKRQLMILSRYTKNVTLLFDNDDPGRKSSQLVISRLSDSGYMKMNLSSIFTPDGFKDIDEYLRCNRDLTIFTERQYKVGA